MAGTACRSTLSPSLTLSKETEGPFLGDDFGVGLTGPVFGEP